MITQNIKNWNPKELVKTGKNSVMVDSYKIELYHYYYPSGTKCVSVIINERTITIELIEIINKKLKKLKMKLKVLYNYENYSELFYTN